MGDEQLKSSSQKMSRLQNAAPSIYEAVTIASTCGCTSKLNPPLLKKVNTAFYAAALTDGNLATKRKLTVKPSNWKCGRKKNFASTFPVRRFDRQLTLSG